MSELRINNANGNNGVALNETYEIVINELNYNNYDLTTISTISASL